MTETRKQSLANMSSRQKAIAVVVVLVVLILGWQVIGMFGGGSSTPTPLPAMTGNTTNPMMPGSPGQLPAGMPTPQPPGPQKVELIKEQPLTEREKQLIALQQETQAKYVAALNELQLLKITKEIAETTRGIAAAKLDTVKNQKDMVEILSGPSVSTSPQGYAQGLDNQSGAPGVIQLQQVGAQSGPTSRPPIMSNEVNYTVVSVSQIRGRWNAVLGAQGSLYSVTVGDVLPADGSTVLKIDKSGVILDKDGQQKKVSMVPII